jgi:hypothetical protein
MMIIPLESWEYEHANVVGIGRYTANWGKSDAPYYDKSRMQDDRTAQVAAAVCELAVAKYTNQYWSGSVWPKEHHSRHKYMADVGLNIEVRRVRTRNSVAVREKDLGRCLYLWAARAIEPELKEVELLGHIDYDQAWNLAEESQFQGTRYLPLDRLNSP